VDLVKYLTDDTKFGNMIYDSMIDFKINISNKKNVEIILQKNNTCQNGIVCENYCQYGITNHMLSSLGLNGYLNLLPISGSSR